MKKIAFLLLSVAIISCQSNKENTSESAEHDHASHAVKKDAPKKKSKSPRKSAMTMTGSNHIHIDYSSPSVRGRQIFGGLVAYGEVWVTGAHKATNIAFDEEVFIADTKLDAGKYGLFTIPGEKTWTIILNKKWDMHLADEYDAQFDVIRIEADVVTTPEVTEALTFAVSAKDDAKTNVSISWANSSVSFEIANHN